MKDKKSIVESVIIKFMCGWVGAALFSALLRMENFLDLAYIVKIDFEKFLLFAMLFTAVVAFLTLVMKDDWFDIRLFLILLTVYGGVIVYCAESIYVSIGTTLMLMVVYKYFMDKYEQEFASVKINAVFRRSVLFIIIVMWIVFVIGLNILRYLTYNTPCFDFGIFSQMFYYMKETFVPFTTCERNELLSHLNVHMSPVLYIILPVYYIFPHPITLLVVQGLFIVAGVIPLYLLCKNNNISKNFTVAIMCIYVLYPALAAGTFYDFHENKLLTIFILWFLHFLDKWDKGKKYAVGSIAFMICVLLTKEDAAIYVACIALYIVFTKKCVKRGVAIFLVSVAYFVGVFYYLKTFGDGAMINRYSNYIGSEGGIVDMLTNIFVEPGYVIYQLFTVEKLEFCVWMLLPIAGIIFKTKRISDYILVIPMIVINLMSNNPYQHSISYQYTYGVTALLFYLIVQNVADMQKNKTKWIECKKMFVYMGIATALLFITAITPKLSYIDDYKKYSASIDILDEVLAEIPEDASVEASTWYVPQLSDRKEIYRLEKDTDYDCDYVIFDLRYQRFQEMYDLRKETLQEKKYLEITKYDNLIVVFEKQ